MKARGTFVLYQVPSLSSESISYHPDANLPHIGLITAVDATMKVANKASVYSRTTNGKVQVVDLFAEACLLAGFITRSFSSLD